MLSNDVNVRAARRDFSKSLSAALAALVVAFSISTVSALAQTEDFDQGRALFAAGKYPAAVQYFKRAVDRYPGDETYWYWYGLSCHYARDVNNAKIAYLECIQRFPGTKAAIMAQKGLASIAPGLLNSAAASSSSMATSGTRSYSGASGGTNSDIIPASSSVNFELDRNHMVVPVAFNGHQTKAVFDTGAEMILMGKNHLAEIGLPAPTGDTIARSRGSDGRIEDVWGMRMDVTCGGVTRKNILVHISEHMDTLPLLGQPFLKGMNYAVESSSIRFSSKTNSIATGGSSYNAVPYKMQGHTMVVQARVNGKEMSMCLDTGAAGTLFTKSQAAQAGITVGDEPLTSLGSGVGGGIIGSYATVSSISLGSVQQRDFRVGVSETNHSPYPLLGKDFWEGHRFSVDEDKHVIHFN